MERPISELTYKIVAFLDIRQIDTDESIDWAIEMIQLGYESPTLYMLASFSKPTNYFEIINYLKDTVKELNLRMKIGNEATLSYASYYVHHIAKSQNIRENLSALYQFCQIRDYEELVYDFYLLYWAWDDLDYEAIGCNHYWEGATRINIETIVVKYAKEWIEKNKEYYSQ